MSIWDWNKELQKAILTSEDAVRDVLSRPVGAKPSEEHLATAIEEGLPTIVSVLLYYGAEIRPYHLTEAIIVDAKSETSIVNILIEYGGKPTFEDLETVIEKGFEESVKFLLENNAPVNELHLSAAIEADVKYGTTIVKTLIEHGAKPTGNHLVIAINNGSPGIVKFLLENNADITPDILTYAINAAVKYGTSIIAILIKYGARPTFEDLEIAVKKGSPDMVKLLLDTNAEDPSSSIFDNDDPDSLIFDTITSNKKYGLSIVAILLEYGAKSTLEELEAAINSGSADMVKHIRENVDITPDSNLTIVAESSDCTYIVDLLIKYGAATTFDHFKTAVHHMNIMSVKTFWKFIPCDKLYDVFNIAVKNHHVFSEGFEEFDGMDPYGRFKNESFELLKLFTVIPSKKHINLFPKGSDAFELLQSRYDVAVGILSFMPHDLCLLILEY